MEKYKEYKDSGVQWLGEIPSHWKAVLNGRIFKEDVRKALDTDISLSLSQKDGLIPTEEMQESSLKTSSYANWKHVTPCDLVINRFKAHLGVMFASNYTGMVSFHYGVFKSVMPTNSKYYEYLFHTNVYKFLYSDVSNGMTVGLQNLSNTAFYKVRGLYPPIDEQCSIVTYLDTKCSQLDTLLSNKEKQISLLQEMKQRVIADAVTRGVNPNVKFKATNIPWLPEIPEHWKIKPIRSLLREVTEKSETGEEELLSLSQYTGISYKKDAKNTGMFDAESTIGYKKVYPGQFVMNIMLAWNGSYAVSGLQGIISPAYCVFDFVSDCDKLYYHYLLRLGIYSGAFKTASRGIIDSRLRLYPNRFYPFPIICPPIDEQKAIVSYITERTSKIDTLIEKLTKEIECVKEYKQRLISDVVTGQVKVC